MHALPWYTGCTALVFGVMTLALCIAEGKNGETGTEERIRRMRKK